jgi:hypothetical protein
MGPGTLLCANVESTPTACGSTDADYVGAYNVGVPMKCDSGQFYDPIYGGTCWKCPDNDSNGNNWVRSANKVTSDDSCWRVPYEKTTSAKFDKNGWAWDCNSSEFWDGDGQNGRPVTGGACWSCPAGYPRRTAYAVTDSRACATPVNQTAPATLVKYLGCPTPNVSTMYPKRPITDKRTPGQPFLDVGSGISTKDAVGSCWACPVVDSAGNFVVTERNGTALTDGKIGSANTGSAQVNAGYTTNNGCTIDVKYKPPAFPEPGLSGLLGVKDVLFEKQIFTRPNDITKYLYSVAAASNMTGVAAQNYVATQWADIAQHPYANSNIRALVLLYMQQNAPGNMYPNGQAPKSPTVAESKLINSFQAYAQARRTYVAQQALNMYDAWNTQQTKYNQSHASSLDAMFSYGTVPPDIKTMVSGITSATGAAVGTIAAFIAGKVISTGAKVVTITNEDGDLVRSVTGSLFRTFNTLDSLLEGGEVAAAAVAGATGIAIAGLILTIIAGDQFNDIQTMRPDLVAAVTTAQQPVVFSSLTSDQQLAFWALGTSAPEREDSQILAMAQAACKFASQNCGQPTSANPLFGPNK